MSNHNRFIVLEVKLLIVTKFDPLSRNFWIFGNPEIFYSFTFYFFYSIFAPLYGTRRHF